LRLVFITNLSEVSMSIQLLIANINTSGKLSNVFVMVNGFRIESFCKQL
jgi:hypothetical protein